MSDKIAEGLGNFFVFVWELLRWVFSTPSSALGVVGIGAGALLLWRLSVALGPQKLCWHCDGNGYTSGLLGGHKECTHCDGKGRRSRIGAK